MNHILTISSNTLLPSDSIKFLISTLYSFFAYTIYFILSLFLRKHVSVFCTSESKEHSKHAVVDVCVDWNPNRSMRYCRIADRVDWHTLRFRGRASSKWLPIWATLNCSASSDSSSTYGYVCCRLSHATHMLTFHDGNNLESQVFTK